ncbi:MAG: PEP-CTERM sorting domain-containing protein [Acidobacteria bacterium]|nr:PEP-CTERM sorting domain-containing protein [Acidobacteriota bacterium]
MKQFPVLVLMAVAALARVEAAPIFGSPTSSGTYSCDGQPTETSPTVAGTTVNNGKAITLSGSGSVSGVGEQCISFTWTGAMSGALEANNSIPLAWDFTVTADGDIASGIEAPSPFFFEGNPYWSFDGTSLNFETYLDGSSNIGGQGIGSKGGAGTQTLNTIWQFSTPPAGVGKAFTFYTVNFRVSALFGANGGTLSVDIPAGTSIDFGPLTDTNPNPAVPEPATMLILPAGIAGILLLRKRI